MALSLLSLLFLPLFPSAWSLFPAEPPLIPDRPFIAVWNAPTDRCPPPVDTGAFQATTTPKLKLGQFLTLFYDKSLGLYPKIDPITEHQQYGGVPQNGNLKAHLTKAQTDIDDYISQDSSPGLAVIDWEGWRPLWDQNWKPKLIYKTFSIMLVQDMEPSLSDKEIIDKAKSQFENAGRRFMGETLKLGIRQRPSRRWGFYLFPDCYNYDWDKVGYTGKCSDKTKEQNNQMLWLWENSTALFPSIYLDIRLRNSPRVALFVQNRVQEALRVAALPNHPHTVPVYVYSRPLYRDQSEVFLTQKDLVSTVGESAALGASGVVLWGASADYNNMASCTSLSNYLSTTLNPYIANVTAASVLCSQVLCQGRGRCVRKVYDSAHYLHLNPAHFIIIRCNGKYVAVGLPSSADLDKWAEHFTCQCYYGWSCSPRLEPPKTIREIWV